VIYAPQKLPTVTVKSDANQVDSPTASTVPANNTMLYVGIIIAAGVIIGGIIYFHNKSKS